MLSLDFEEAINTILASLPREGRTTYLFSATMTSQVAKLLRASLVDPVRVEVSDKYGTVSTLVQQYLFIPAKYKVRCVRAQSTEERAVVHPKQALTPPPHSHTHRRRTLRTF